MNFNLPPQIALLVVTVVWLATALIHIAFAIGVFKAAEKLEEGGDTHFVPPMIWALATLIGGVVTAGIYWALHHSTLCPAKPKESSNPPA